MMVYVVTARAETNAFTSKPGSLRIKHIFAVSTWHFVLFVLDGTNILLIWAVLAVAFNVPVHLEYVLLLSYVSLILERPIGQWERNERPDDFWTAQDEYNADRSFRQAKCHLRISWVYVGWAQREYNTITYVYTGCTAATSTHSWNGNKVAGLCLESLIHKHPHS
jgi:hypothetical protein